MLPYLLMAHRLLIILLCLFGMDVSPVHAVFCNFTGAPSPWVSHPQYYFTKASAESSCQSFAAQVGKICNGPYSCAGKDTGDCSWRAGYVEYWVDIVNFSLNPHTYDQYQFLYCADTLIDTDGDGIPDSTDPCPNNPDPDCTDPSPDTDGDGTPDDQDPCPNNPDPDCTDPNDPPKPPPPDIPGEIVIGDCTVDITSLKAWLLSDDSFPFNFIWRIYSVISPLLDLSPEPPVLEFDFSLDPSSKYSWVPDTVPLKFDFTQFDFLAKLLRYFEIAGLCLAFAFYGMKRYRNFTGAGG